MKKILSVIRGGGGVLELLYAVFRGCKINRSCYNDDVTSHNYNEVLIMKKAFTLAEVLVTLGIIGVVSAMTVPTLMQNHQRKTYVTQLHKVYNEISQVLLQYQSDRNAVNLTEAGLTSDEAFQNAIESYMKVVSTCDTMGSPCFSDSYKDLNGAATSGIQLNHKSYVIANGASLRPYYQKAADKLYNLYVDINGQQGPNILGRDLFVMGVYNNGLLDVYSNGVVTAPLTKEQREKAGEASAAWTPFANILNDNWEMNY